MSKLCDDRGGPYKIARLSSAQYEEISSKLNMVTTNLFVNVERVLFDHRGVGVVLIGGVLGYLFWFFAVAPIAIPVVGYFFSSFLGFLFAVLAAKWFLHLLYGWVLRGRYGIVAEVYLAHGYCVSCGYSLIDLVVESDGCVVCPECNAAWKKERLGISEDDE